MTHKIFTLVALLAITTTAIAAQNSRKPIYVNSEVTTHIVMPENLKLVDISTENVAGDQCADNMIRIKPLETTQEGESLFYTDNKYLGTITLIGERHMAQFDIIYEINPRRANSYYKVDYDESYNYSNPETGMPESEMIRLAWTVFDSKRKFHNIREKQYGIKAEVYNIYTIGDYFFIDFKLSNKTDIPYDIAEIRVSLSDKKQTKATNYQTIELTPLYVFNKTDKFKKDYRNVIVLEKLTFPEEKVLNIEVSENQISGRVITIPIQYDDILHADAINVEKIDKELEIVKNTNEIITDYQKKEAEMQQKNYDLSNENKNLHEELFLTKAELHEANKSLKDKINNIVNKIKPKKKNKKEYIYTETTVVDEEEE